MGSLSKCFYEATKNKTCADFVHPSMSCWESGMLESSKKSTK